MPACVEHTHMPTERQALAPPHSYTHRVQSGTEAFLVVDGEYSYEEILKVRADLMIIKPNMQPTTISWQVADSGLDCALK